MRIGPRLRTGACVLTACGLALVLLAGCTAVHTRTVKAADELVHSADAFAAGSCFEPNGVLSTNPAACRFADQAHVFRLTLDRQGDQDVVLAFQSLWRSYRALRDETYHLRDDRARTQLQPVTEAFVGVQRNVISGYSHADPTLYASGGYLLDPYYN
jgi:hypothetical protein